MSETETKKIIFMGTSSFSLKSLSALYKKQVSDGAIEIVAVYTQTPKPSGRGQKIHKSAVHEFAELNGISVHTPRSLKSNDEFDIFRSIGADLAIVSSYGLIIPQNILDIPKYGFINIHASLLPRWRGASPMQSAILAGDKLTGITIMKMNAGVDTGDIIEMQSFDISEKISHGDLNEKIGNLGADMIVDTVDNLEDRLSKAYEQPSGGVTYSQKISKESCRINWHDTAKNILRKVMAFSPTPAAWSEIDGLRIKILDADIMGASKEVGAEKTFGKLFIHENDLMVSCKDGFISILKLQPAGKNPMTGKDFIRGRRDLIGKIFS